MPTDSIPGYIPGNASHYLSTDPCAFHANCEKGGKEAQWVEGQADIERRQVAARQISHLIRPNISHGMLPDSAVGYKQNLQNTKDLLWGKSGTDNDSNGISLINRAAVCLPTRWVGVGGHCINLNSILTHYCECKRGLKWGDCLSPLLFRPGCRWNNC